MVHLTLLTVAPEGIRYCFRTGKPVYIITVQFVLIFLKNQLPQAPTLQASYQFIFS